MKNVLDIYRNNKLNYILPLNAIVDECKITDSVLIIVHLHYIDDIDYYIHKINSIPIFVDVIVTSSSDKVKSILEKKCERKYKFLQKQNRGRDISAILVTCAEEIEKYKYICFVHDKKANRNVSEENTYDWVQCIWENLLGSAELICNIINTFEQEKQLGILFCPIPLNNDIYYAYTNVWCADYELTKTLAKKLNITKCDLDEEKTPIAIGTAFWARTESLKKLFALKWTYDCFDEEPLAADGTLSHAVERIFAYAAQDAGYNSGIVYNNKYAEAELIKNQELLKSIDDVLYDYMGVRNLYETELFSELEKKLKNFIKECSNIYIYGAGIIGKKCLQLLQNNNRIAKAFLVTRNNGKERFYRGIPVYELKDIVIEKEDRIIVAANSQNQLEIIDILKAEGISAQQYIVL